MSLTLDKGYEAVTVGEICEAANVGRSTFYAHFPNKDALLRSGMDNLRKMLTSREHSRKEPFGFTLAMFEHARSHRDLHGALAGGAAIAIESVREILSDLVRKDLKDAAEPMAQNAMPPELAVRFVVGAFMAVVGWWLDSGARLPAAEVDAMFQRLLTEGVGSSDSAGPR